MLDFLSKKKLLIKKSKVSAKTIFFLVFVLSLFAVLFLCGIYLNNKFSLSHKIVNELNQRNSALLAEIESLKSRIVALENEDTRKTNQTITQTIKEMQDTYKKAVSVYEDLIDLRETTKNTKKLDELYAASIQILSTQDYASASSTLSTLSNEIEKERQKASQITVSAPANIPVNNSPPGSGYQRQQVATDIGTYTVSIVSGDLSSTKVIVDTASDSDCSNNCPVLSLSTYVSRNNAYAGVNGSYFCPVSYPTCQGKTNSFDLLLMNKNKTYFNSNNNVYSNNPGVIFGGSYIRFVSAVSQWGRDTGIDSMISNYPLLIEGGNIRFSGDSDPKKGSKGNRSFVGSKGNAVYIGVVHNVTVAESAIVLKALGLENALNLDSGGSTALYSGGYKVGPGRDIPNAVLFVRK